MSVNPHNYPQEGQTFQRSVKKRKHRFLKTMAIFLVITVLSMSVVNYFVEPFFISRLTKGFIFGFLSAEVKADELADAISIGPLTVTVNEKTGFEVDLSAIGSVNLRYNRQTGDITLFGGIGASLGTVTSGISGRLGIFATINPKTMDITSGTRIGAEGQLAGNGFGYEKDVCFATGADKTTVSKILLHKNTSTTTSD